MASRGRPEGFVLAGGRSRRMGTDKARLPLADRWPMAMAVAAVLSTVCSRVRLVRRQPDELPWLWQDGRPIEVIYDGVDGDRHPLYGVAAALAAAQSELVLVAPCDLPHLVPEDVAALCEAGAVASDGERLLPLLAVYPRSAAELALAAAQAGRSATSFAEGRPVVTLSAAHLADADRPEDLPEDVLAGLSRRFAAVPGIDHGRLVRGEVARLAARGAVPRKG